MSLYLVTSPSHFKKHSTVHAGYCRYFQSSYGEPLSRKEIKEKYPDGIDCKVCGGAGGS